MKTYNPEGYIVRISENALIQMCMNGLEAYLVPHETPSGKKKRVETIGLLWGHENLLPNGQTFYSVELVTIDTSAVRRTDSCKQMDSSLKLKRDLMTSFWPQYDFLDDFHTHPAKDHNVVTRDKLYQFSEDDIRVIEDDLDWITHNYRVGIVMTIAQMQRRSGSFDFPDEGTVCLTLGNFKIWIKAYVAYLEEDKILLSAHTDPNVILDCPMQIGIIGEHTRFGGMVKGKKSKRYEPGEI
jgi:hypothetical protein